MTSRLPPSEDAGGAPAEVVRNRYSFLLACARDHEPRTAPLTPIDELRIFDNSLHRVADHIRVLASSAGGWPASYEQYLDLRMRVFATAVETGDFDLVELLGGEGGPELETEELQEVLDELGQLLSSQEPAESQALLRRLEQLPKEAVVDEWYRKGPAFEGWAESVVTRERERERERWLAIKSGGYTELLKRAAKSSNGDRSHAEHIQRRLSAASQELVTHMRGEAGLSADAIDALQVLEPVETPPLEDLQGPSGSALLHVSTALADKLDARGVDLLNEFLVELARACKCEVCDFVEVQGGQLRPTGISDPSSELKQLLEKPYQRGEGIAGSAMLLRATSERRWVGTNDLASDPRQSKDHAALWSKATKSTIYDYWVFPVYQRDGSCYGGFRVFNRLRSCWENGIPWSEGMLWELREVAAWFESAILPALNEDPVVPRTVGTTAHSAAVQHLKAELGLKWVEENFLVRLITHATQVAHRKVETLSLGCCLGVFADPRHVLRHNSPYYAAGEVSFDTEDASLHLENAGMAYGKINPAAGMFVFDSNGRGHDVINLRGSDSADTGKALAQLSEQHPQSLLLFLDRGQDCIRIIADGWVAADYYLSEATGEWTLRMYRQLIGQAIEEAPSKLSALDVHEVFERAIDLSYERIGAMLILGDGVPDNVAYEHETPLTDVNLRALSPFQFADMAAADGAVRIEPAKGVTAFGALVRFAPLPDPHIEERPKGSRHSSASALSAMAPDHMVFVVSENRTLTVMAEGNPFIDRR